MVAPEGFEELVDENIVHNKAIFQRQIGRCVLDLYDLSAGEIAFVEEAAATV